MRKQQQEVALPVAMPKSKLSTRTIVHDGELYQVRVTPARPPVRTVSIVLWSCCCFFFLLTLGLGIAFPIVYLNQLS